MRTAALLRSRAAALAVVGLLSTATATALALAPARGDALASTGTPPGWEIPSATEKMVMSVADSRLAAGDTLTDFPVQVALSAPSFDYDDGANPADLVFTTAGSSTPLPYEVEAWNPSSTSTIWVQVPTLSSTASELDLYFGAGTPANTTSASSVWDANFLTVDHSAATSGTAEPDSTANHNDGTLGSGTSTLDVAGEGASPALMLGTTSGSSWSSSSAVSFGTAVGADTSGSNSFANGVTFSTSFYTPAADVANTSSYYIIGGRDRSGGQQPGEQFSLVLYKGQFFPRVIVDQGGTLSGTVGASGPPYGSLYTTATAGWHDLTFTYDDATIALYLDGTQVASYADPGVIPSAASYAALPPSNALYTTTLQPFTLNSYSNGGGQGGFTYDEAELSDIARPADWVQAQYLAQTNQLVSEEPYQTQSSGTTGTTGTTTSPPPAWQVGSAQERLKFQVADANISSTLQNFPVEVQLDTSDFDYADANPNNLVFTMDGDTTDAPLPYEIESWKPTGTSTIWVQVATLTATAQTLDLYYDGAPANATSPTAVWDSNFMMVNHFNATSGSTILDSTANGIDGAPWSDGAAANASVLTFGSPGETNSPAVGAGGGEMDFGTSVGADNSGPNSFADGATFSVEFYTPASDLSACQTAYCIIGGRDLGGGSEPGEQFSLVLYGGVFLPRVAIFKPGNPVSSDIDETLNPYPPASLQTPATAGWHDLTLTYDDSTVRFYLDGQLVGSYADAGVLPSLADYQATTTKGSATLTISPTGTLQPFILNGYSNSAGDGSFTYDDMQLSSLARSADWVNAQYLAQAGEIATPAPASEMQGGGLQLDITTPAANGSTAGSAKLAGYVSERSDVSYTIDGGSSVDVGQESSGFSVPVPGLSSGQHTLVVTATAAGGTTSMQTVAFTAYTAGPTITFTTPTNGERFGQNQSFTLSVGASDPAGVSSTTITLGGQAVQNAQSISASSLSAGPHTLSVVSTDAVGNTTTQSIAFSTTGDTLIGDSTPVFQVTSTEPSQQAILTALAAALPAGAAGPLTVSGYTASDFQTPGEYPVTVSDSDSADGVGSANATLEVVPVSVVTVPNQTVYSNTSTPPTAASILSASGAEITDGSGNVVFGTLSVSVPQGCGAAAGSCIATVTGTDLYGFPVRPVALTVDVSAAAVSVANATATLTDTGSAPSAAALVAGLGATVANSAGGGQPVVSTSGVDWSLPGTYGVTVGDSDAHDAAATVTASIRVVPVPVVTVAATTVYLPVNANDPLPAATLLANAGATLTDGEGNAVAGTLAADTSAVNGTVAGTYAATITGTDDYGFKSAPVAMTVVMYLSAQPAGTVSITGTAAVGQTLTASLSGWAGLAAAEYQWLLGGLPISGATSATYTVIAADAGHSVSVEVTEAPQWYDPASATSAAVAVAAGSPASATTTPSGTVPSSLSISLGNLAPSLGVLLPGLAATYDGTMTASVTTTAPTSVLTIDDPSSIATGHLVNGPSALVSPLQVDATDPGQPVGVFAPLDAGPVTLLSYAAPITSDPVTIGFQQAIGATEALRAGSYSEQLIVTLSTSTP